jgi:pyruvate dehydrogenase E1 component alpha subunit
MNALFAELYGKETGANGGKAGSQDISYPECHFYSGAILAGAVAIGVGAAFGEKLRGSDHVVATGFGEAATEEGVFWEAINFAALKKLPIVFVCENNRYSTFSPQLDRQVADNLHERVQAFGVPSQAIFGNDVLQVYKTLEQAFHQARTNAGPTFVQAYTYRWNGHVGPGTDDGQGYRTNDEIDYWKLLCPIRLLEQALATAGRLDPEKQARLLAEIDDEIAAAFAFAKASAFPCQTDWQEANYGSSSPLADRLLHDVEGSAFNQYQKDAVPGPY